MRAVKIFWKRLLKKTIPPLVAPLAQKVLTLILKTCKIEYKGLSHLKETAHKKSCILALWHNHLTPVANLLEKSAPEFIYVPVISNSRDGEILTKFLRKYKQCAPLRIPHDGRHVAIHAIKEKLSNPKTVVVITPDGPRGPRHKVKRGTSIAAKESASPVLTMHWTATNYWTLNTWDKMMIPKPFSTITLTINEPMINPSSEEIEKNLS